MLGMWDIQDVRCWEYGMLGMGLLGMQNVQDMGCWGYRMLKMQDVGDAGCWGCGMLAGMWDVDLQNAVLDQCSAHIETSQSICGANQLTGFYMNVTLVIIGLT